MLFEVGATAATALGASYGLAKLLGKNKKGLPFEAQYLAKELDFDYLHADQATIVTKGGEFFRIYEISGVNYDAKPVEQQKEMHQARSEALHQLGRLNLSLRFFGIKRREDLGFEQNWPNPVLQEIGEAEQKAYANSYHIRWFLIMSAPKFGLLELGSETLANNLATYRPRLLQAQEKNCPLSGFLNYLICGELRRDLGVVSQNISANIPAAELNFNRDTGILETHVPRRYVQKIMTIRAWQNIARGRLISEILKLDGDIEVSQVSLSTTRSVQLHSFGRRQNELIDPETKNYKKGVSQEEADEVQTVFELLNNDKATIFNTQYAIILRAENEENLNIMSERVSQILGAQMLNGIVETVGMRAVWFNRCPGRNQLIVPLRLLNSPIAAFWPFHHSNTGMRTGPYGPMPVRLTKTLSGQPYAFQYHVSEKRQSLGNYLAFAPSGSGKSTLLTYLLSGLAKFDGARSYFFDSKEGAKFMIKALGGHYQNYENLALNPLDCGAETPITRLRIHNFLAALLQADPESADHDQILNHATKAAFLLGEEARTLNNIYEASLPTGHKLRHRALKWVHDHSEGAGRYAHIFNAPRDSLANVLTNSFLVGINMTEALNDPVLGPPLLIHIISAIQTAGRSSHSGHNILIDESANLLQNAQFKRYISELFREIRREDGCVGLVYQDPEALIKSGIADEVRQNTATMLFWPNSNAETDSLRQFNLTSEQIEFIKSPAYSAVDQLDHGKRKRHVMAVKRDAATGFEETTILDVDLSHLGNSLRFFRAGAEANRLQATLEAQHGAAWASYL